MDRNYVATFISQPLYQNAFILRRPTLANFADIIKIPTMFIKKTIQDLKKSLKNYKVCVQM